MIYQYIYMKYTLKMFQIKIVIKSLITIFKKIKIIVLR